MTPVRYHAGHFPPQNLDWQRLLPLIGPAHTAVAGYEGMLKLYGELRDWAVEETPSLYSGRALDWVFGKPIFRQIDFVNSAGIPNSTARRLLDLFKLRGILKVLVKGGGRRSAILAFPELLNIAEGRRVF